jgi:hypothetical protein
MNFSEKHFHREALFQAPESIVLEAIRLFWAKDNEWIIEDPIPGTSRIDLRKGANHAWFEVEPEPGGVKVTVDYDVPRLGATGFMLWDIGGYYDRTIDKWLHGVWVILGEMYQRAPWDLGHAVEPPAGTAPPQLAIGQRVVVFDADHRPFRGTIREFARGMVGVVYEDGRERWIDPHDAHLDT